MRRSILVKTATGIAGLAAALSLSACSFEFSVGPNDRDDRNTEEEQQTDADDQQETERDRNDDTSDTDSGTDTGSGSESGSDEYSSGGGSSTDSSSGSGSGDTVTVPASELAQSVKEAAERESGVSGITVTCRDLKAYDVGSTTTCDMTMPDGKKYFPLVKVTSINGSYVEYELEFPGVHF